MAKQIFTSKFIKYKTPASELNELCLKQKISTPIYEVIHNEGPAHSPLFTVQAIVDDYIGEAKGKTIKEAKQLAALIALNDIKLNNRSSLISSLENLKIENKNYCNDCSPVFNQKKEFSQFFDDTNKNLITSMSIDIKDCMKHDLDFFVDFVESMEKIYSFSLKQLLKLNSNNKNYVNVLNEIALRLDCIEEYIEYVNSSTKYTCLLNFKKIITKNKKVNLFISWGNSYENFENAKQKAAIKAINLIKIQSEYQYL